MPNLRRGMMGAAGVSGGGIYAWGGYCIGHADYRNRSSAPVLIGSATVFSLGSGCTPGNPGGASTSLYVTDEYKAYVAGKNQGGQLMLGHENFVNDDGPQQIGALSNWAQFSFGYNHMTAIKTDGTLWWCGDAYQDGPKTPLNNATNYSSPVQVGSQTDWAKVQSHDLGTHAIKTNGKLYCWGRNFHGALGIGNIDKKCSPVQVGAQTDWAGIAKGADRAIAGIKTSGKLYTWGYAGQGVLGTGGTTNRSSPVQVGSLTNWTVETASSGRTMAAIKSDGTLWTWGMASSGGLGNGTTSPAICSPVQVGSDTDWSKIAPSERSAFAAIKTSGKLYAWGYNGRGALGQGDTTNRSSPTQVGSGTNWTKISCRGAGFIGVRG